MNTKAIKLEIINKVKSTIIYPLTNDEIEAIIYHLIKAKSLVGHYETSFKCQYDYLAFIRKNKLFKKNTLLALQILNRFARDHGIRFQDAETVFNEIIN